MWFSLCVGVRDAARVLKELVQILLHLLWFVVYRDFRCQLFLIGQNKTASFAEVFDSLLGVPPSSRTSSWAIGSSVFCSLM